MTQSTGAPQSKIGHRSSHEDMLDFLRSPEKMRLGRMDKTSHPGWIADLEELSAKAGVAAPSLYRVPTHRINGTMAADALILTDGLLKVAGSSAHDYRPSKEVLMIIAHELGHRKQGLALMSSRVLLPMALPMAAIAALHLYDKAQAKKPNPNNKDLKDAIDEVTDNTIASIRKTHGAANFDDEASRQATVQWKESILRNGRYVLAGALGLTVGLMGSRAISLHLEHDADRMAALLTGDMEGYIGTLKKLHKIGGDMFKQELRDKPCPETVAEKIQDFVYNQFKDIIGNTIHAHPSIEEREAFLRRAFTDRVTRSRAPGTTLPNH